MKARDLPAGRQVNEVFKFTYLPYFIKLFSLLLTGQALEVHLFNI
jgi:hypothetical protein